MPSESGSEELRGLARSIQGLFAREFPVPTSLESVDGGIGEVAWVAEAGVRLPGDIQEPDPLQEAVEAYLGAGDPDRDAACRSLEAAAEDARERRAAGAMARAAEALVLAGEGDAEALRVARSLATPGVATLLVTRLVTAPMEEERRRGLTGALPRLGGEVEEAVLEALRQDPPDPEVPAPGPRALLGVLGGLMDAGSPILERMLEESDWRIVRIAIHVAEERGGQGLVQHLTVALGHSDGRARKEALLALSRLADGDASDREDASMLTASQLEDPDPSVRAQAVRTAAALRVERALKPLLALLEREADQDVLIEVIRTLGVLGDPSAVIPLEKRATSGFFARSPQVVRVAAYRALGAIGTPHAMEVVRAAAQDRDPEVRRTAEAVLRAVD